MIVSVKAQDYFLSSLGSVTICWQMTPHVSSQGTWCVSISWLFCFLLESPSNNTEVGLETKTFFLLKRLLIREKYNVCEWVYNFALAVFCCKMLKSFSEKFERQEINDYSLSSISTQTPCPQTQWTKGWKFCISIKHVQMVFSRLFPKWNNVATI